jgi:hypothetical protein
MLIKKFQLLKIRTGENIFISQGIISQENIFISLVYFNLGHYYIHFEINGVSCNPIGSQECDFSTNRTPSSAIRAEIATSFNQSH